MIFEKFKFLLEREMIPDTRIVVLAIPPFFTNYERNILI